MNHAMALVKESRKLKGGKVYYWVLRWRDHNGKHRAKSLGRCDKLSKRAATKTMTLMKSGFYENPSRRSAGKALTLREYTDIYFESRKHELAVKTIKSYKDAVRYLICYLGEHRAIDQISRADAALFKTELAAGKLKSAMKRKVDLEPSTVNIHMRSIKAIFGKAVRDDLLQSNPFDRSVTTIKKSTAWHYLTSKEFQAICNKATPKFRLVVSLCRLAGLRRQEALELEWSNIDWDKNRITVVGKNDWQPKSRKTRVVPMCQELQSVLSEAHGNAPVGARRVLYDIYEGNLTRDLKAIVKRSGVEVYLKPLHTLRKSCITDWAGKHPLHVVKEWAGHADIATTAKYYSKVRDCDYEQAANSFWDTPKAREAVV